MLTLKIKYILNFFSLILCISNLLDFFFFQISVHPSSFKTSEVLHMLFSLEAMLFPKELTFILHISAQSFLAERSLPNLFYLFYYVRSSY